MKLGRTVGEVLKEAREAVETSLKQAASDTNISFKYLEALEADDWSQFPGEPYLLGFLQNYGEYLKLDSEELLLIYKAAKINEMPAPLEELTKRTYPLLEINKKMVLAFLAVVLVTLLIIFLPKIDTNSFISKIGLNKSDTIENAESVYGNYKIHKHAFEKDNSTRIIFNKLDGRILNLNNQEVHILFMDVKGYQKGITGSGRLVLGINIYPEKRIEKIELVSGKKLLLSFEESRFANLKQELILELIALRQNSARIKVTKGKLRPGEKNETFVNASDPENVQIRLVLKFKGKSWCKFILDGEQSNAGIIQASSEPVVKVASNKLEAHIGDAGAVEYSLDGKTFKVLGQKGKAVIKTFIKVPDEFDPTKFRIKILGE